MNDIKIRFMYPNIKELEPFNDKLIQEYMLHIPPNNNNDIELEYELNINCIPKLIKVTIVNEKIKFDLIKQNFGISQEKLGNFQNEEIGRDENDLIMKEVIAYKNDLEDYIYKLRDKINSEKAKVLFNDKEKENLVEEMDKVMQWLYSNDEDLYNIHKLEEKSKNMKQLGDIFLSKLYDWDGIKQNLTKMETLLYEKLAYFASMEEQIKRGEKKDMTIETINKINEYIQKEFNNFEAKMYEIDIADKTKEPKINVNDIENMLNIFNDNINKMEKGQK